MSQDFPALAGRIVDALLQSDPVTAFYAGDHRVDDRLPDFSSGGVAARTAMLHDAANALAQVDADVLEPEDLVDHAQLSTAVDRRLFDLTEVRNHEWDPLAHNPGVLLHGLLTSEFAPVADRLEVLAGRLAAVPDALATARETLRDCPTVHLETAIGQFAGVASLIRDELPAFAAQAPGVALDKARDDALAALAEFDGWLREAVLRPGRDPRLGRRLWEGKLWYTLDTELPASQLLDRAMVALDDATAQLVDLCGGVPVREALDALGADRPDNTTILELSRRFTAEATEFCREHDLVTMVTDPLVIEEMPEFARGVAVAYCMPVGPFETAELPTTFAISPAPRSWSPERVESFYREYNNHMLRNLAVHEAMPGHYLQLAHSRRFRGSNPARALCRSGVFTEGWAVYTEELMADAGFGGHPVKLAQLKMQLRMAINAVLDQLAHCEDLSEAEGMALMLERGFQEDGEAAGKWRRALLTSTQLSTYFVGYTEMSSIAAARPAGTSVREWHDAMLGHGSPAPRHLRTLLGV
ncbi:hypothetical protein Lfu02_28290 [Longispora fulva]|uniref:Uncharacterized protein (DUF885 family) n=1 Tax=Longispora fulva TaxID=619741 RepID=A0A8J7KL68_9ACTN|nr:DUF885 domain-containing protein [Longispora fulva]MBG6138964.1 uncharacterized protein (DUF885 family) [Longispora fulva]GIG58457.1 hypothetical protein Lfu02_28290 [Longispora fulva]